MLISHNGGVGCVLLNQNEVKFEAKKIGFNVIIFEPTPMIPMHKAYELIQFFSGLARCSCKWCRLGLNGPQRFAMKDWLGKWGQRVHGV